MVCHAFSDLPRMFFLEHMGMCVFVVVVVVLWLLFCGCCFSWMSFLFLQFLSAPTALSFAVSAKKLRGCSFQGGSGESFFQGLPAGLSGFSRQIVFGTGMCVVWSDETIYHV